MHVIRGNMDRNSGFWWPFYKFYIFDMLFKMGMGIISNKQVSVAILSRLGDFGLRLTGLIQLHETTPMYEQ